MIVLIQTTSFLSVSPALHIECKVSDYLEILSTCIKSAHKRWIYQLRKEMRYSKSDHFNPTVIFGERYNEFPGEKRAQFGNEKVHNVLEFGGPI